MALWFTSDLHFGHANIIKYCNRPFSNVDEMDEALIRNWNSRVSYDDCVYVIGDFALSKPDCAVRVLNRLNGNKVLIEGNHDRGCLNSPEFRAAFRAVHKLFELDLPAEKGVRHGTKIVMCHYAMRVWNKSHHGAIHLYGHSHGSLPDDRTALSMDVGVDANSYAPVSLEEVIARMAKKSWKPADHHGYRGE
jgi:calcineurin-like phosphoesterase family protein